LVVYAESANGDGGADPLEIIVSIFFITTFWITVVQYLTGSAYSLVGEFAGLIQQECSVYICHQFLLVSTKNALVPSTPFSRGFT
jgi:hypothetical protein